MRYDCHYVVSCTKTLLTMGEKPYQEIVAVFHTQDEAKKYIKSQPTGIIGIYDVSCYDYVQIESEE